jgi:hypothetical protein
MKWGFFFIFLIFLSSCRESDSTQYDLKEPIKDDTIENTSTSIAHQQDSPKDTITQKQKLAPDKKRRLTPEPDMQIVQEETSVHFKEPKTSIQAHYVLVSNSIQFEKNYTYSDPSVGCGNSSYSMQFSVPVADSHFVITGQDLQSINFAYNHSGGLLFYNSTEVLDGYIEGRKLANGNWDVLVKVFFKAEETPSLSESSEHNVKMHDEYSML